MRSGTLSTPQGANGAIAQTKDAIRRLDATSDAIGGASDIKMGKRIALLGEDASRTNDEMSVIALLAIAVAAMIGVRVRGVMKEAA